MEKAFGTKPSLHHGGRGEFTIRVDDRIVFDKATRGGFPTDGEAVDAVRAVVAGG
ncbi:MAG: Rdx family protein [Kofleriaceae bacterium]|nr:Rdx family protein [Kofleriaceae bacterium]MBP9172205.1 Rdx family protein [Kofleriaceae bacterium]MBP9861375.1 Rdx family protein [Kofleriaceae bacterium]